jgi:hypothetical protein
LLGELLVDEKKKFKKIYRDEKCWEIFRDRDVSYLKK